MLSSGLPEFRQLSIRWLVSTANEDDRIFLAVEPALVTLWISGEVDLVNIDWLRHWLRPLRHIDANVHLQLEGLRFIGASATSMVIDVAETLPIGRTCYLHRPPKGMRMMLERIWPNSRLVVADQEARDDDPPGPWTVVRQWDSI